ncbi:MAG: hypothetical protein GWN00_03660, partial [Aliifodinibius sp.]|nr:hypothetical protein [candidate division Zixibacteria bacterium]NIT55350.1 hypothetical protein [Fodinibius sp.]NIS44768.1 hypothetical protein [candidate division Zixibacteria bacterium]NIU12859.1 hypothetical protein [candidate division Zixibacteria bacterium]NIV04937.1 hypothetical protein [candidate division Zixibacteria bacterium]
AEQRAQEELTFVLQHIAAELEHQVVEKEQYMQDQARLPSTIELYDYAVDSNSAEDWENIAAYRDWQNDFAAGQPQEDDIIATYVGFKGFNPAVAPVWLPIP